MLDKVRGCGKLTVSGQGYQRVAFLKTQSARPYLTTEESKRFGTCAQHRVTRFSLAGKPLTHGVGRKSFNGVDIMADYTTQSESWHEDYGRFDHICPVCGEPRYLGINWPHTDCDNALHVPSPEEKKRNWFNRHRAKIAKRIFERDGASCKHCGATEKLTIDHIIPIKQGGSNEDDNFQVLCGSCNSRKGAR